MVEEKISPSFPSKHIEEDAVEVFVEMPQRNSKKQDQHAATLRRSPRFLGNDSNIQAGPTSILRRSPRFLPQNRDESKDLKTPSPEKKGAMVSFLETSSCISTPKECLKASKLQISVSRHVLKESNFGKQGSGEEIKGSRKCDQLKAGGEGVSCVRRSARLSGKENINWRLNFDEFKKENRDLGKKDMRVTGNPARKGCNEKGYDGKPLVVTDCNSANLLGKGGLSGQQSEIVVIGLPVESIGEAKKKGNSKQGNAQKLAKIFFRNRIDRSAEDSKVELLDKGASLCGERIPKSDLGPSDQETVGAPGKAPVKGGLKSEARAVVKKEKSIGAKRKRNQVEDGGENQRTFSGWTKEQDEALQKAYFAANPTPHFWKKVARMVPGKSAQDCFDRIHADYLTPRQAQPRSRARLLNSSPLSYSASKLLDSIRPKSKRPGYTRRKPHLVQKTMRQLLQKQCQINRDQNADLFSILEPKLSPSPNASWQGINCSTPKQEKPIPLRRCQETSSSANRMQCSRFNSTNDASLASPPVLKPIKNKALHEKYLDQLHAREAKRKAASARAAKSSLQVLNVKECRVQKNAVESAKNALLLDARDAINQFQHVQANDQNSFPDDDDDDVLYSDEDVSEGEDRI